MVRFILLLILFVWINMTLEEMQAFHILRPYKFGGCEVDDAKAKEAGDYIIDLANKIKKSRMIGPWVMTPRSGDYLLHDEN